MLTRRAAVSLLAGCLAVAASAGPAAAQNAEKLKVVASF
jgi:zinc/manganese transport system substrate-binding protein